MLLLAWTTTAHAGLDDDISKALGACARADFPLPTLSKDQRDLLAAGSVVKIVNKADDPNAASSAIGIAILDARRPDLWVAAQDEHASVDPSLVEFIVEEMGSDHMLWYGHIDLPRPITDRQWVVDSSNNHALGSACWEHRWRLIANGLAKVRPSVAAGERRVTLAQLEEAIYTPVNTGNWLMAPLPDGRTLVSYQATSVIGGSIPDWLVLQLTMSRLESVLRTVETRAHSWVPEHYRGGHHEVFGGDGKPLPTYP